MWDRGLFLYKCGTVGQCEQVPKSAIQYAIGQEVNLLREMDVRGGDYRKWRVKIVEKAGQIFRSQLSKSDT